MTGFALDLLLGAHEPGEPVEASLVLMALAAINGRNRDGSPMKGDGRGATVAALARELGLSRDAVRRGLAALAAVGAARRDVDGWLADEAALAHRARDPRTWLRLDARARRCGVAEVPALFVVALALGQLDERNGHAVLGRTRIAELTGWYGTGPKTTGRPTSRVDRAIRQAVRSGALAVRSRLPESGLPCYVPGPGARHGDGANERCSEDRVTRRTPCSDATNESSPESVVTRRTRAPEAGAGCRHATNPLSSRDEPPVATRRTPTGTRKLGTTRSAHARARRCPTLSHPMPMVVVVPAPQQPAAAAPRPRGHRRRQPPPRSATRCTSSATRTAAASC